MRPCSVIGTLFLSMSVAAAEVGTQEPGHMQCYCLPFSGNSILLPLSAHSTLKTAAYYTLIRSNLSQI